MAELTHSAVAQIYGIESWQGRTFLIVECLAGGTLKDRLRRGPVSAPDAVSVILTLAGALAAVHDAENLRAFAEALCKVVAQVFSRRPSGFRFPIVIAA